MNKEEIEELAFKDRKELANLNELDLLEIIEFLQLDRKQWINQYSTAHNDYVDLQQENQELKKQYCERTDCSGRLGNSKKVEQLEKELEQLKEIEKEHQRINGCLHLEIKELKDRIDKAFEIIDLIKPELWNISNKMTYRLLDVKTTLKGDKE